MQRLSRKMNQLPDAKYYLNLIMTSLLFFLSLLFFFFILYLINGNKGRFPIIALSVVLLLLIILTYKESQKFKYPVDPLISLYSSLIGGISSLILMLGRSGFSEYFGELHLFLTGLIGGLLGLISGKLAINEIKKHPELQGKTLASFSIFISYFDLVLIGLFFLSSFSSLSYF